MKARCNNEVFSTQVLQLLDAVFIWLSFVFAGVLREPIRAMIGMPEEQNGGLAGMMWVVYILVPMTPLVLERFGFYEGIAGKLRGRAFGELLRALVVMGTVVGLVAIFGKIIDARRLVLGIGFLLVFGILWVRNLLTARLLQRAAARPENRENVLLVGDEEEVAGFMEDLDPDRVRTWNILDRFDLSGSVRGELEALIKEESLQRVIFLSRHTEFERVARAVETCEIQGVEAWIGATFLRTQVARPSFDFLGGLPMLVFRSTPELSWQLFAKKVIDVTGASVILIGLSPILIAAWLGVRFSSPGAPAVFTQERSGLYGKPFKIYKMRTMVPNAEDLLNKIKEEHGNEVDGPAFKLATDPRIFPFGAFLRKYSIDELPQMLNVLKGEMSLVGPRPLPLHEIDAIANSAHRRRLSMKPGITCLWQISGRSDITDFDEWVKLDVDYIDRWSLWEDFRILLKTIPAVLFSKGAR
jgi:exopolysaccharide biosynthesis polyprenyl glycosylphosphotransferase